MEPTQKRGQAGIAMQLSRVAQGSHGADRLPVIAGAVLLMALVSFGGASRADALTQPFIRIVSVLVIAVIAWRFTAQNWRRIRVPAMLLIAFVILCMVQLVPLPPGLWRALPGHARFAQLLLSNGFEVGWRPWTMTPDYTLNALLATLPGFAVLLVLGSMSNEQFAKVPLALLVTVALCALLGLMQLYSHWPYPYAITNFGTPVGFFANRNHAALLLAMTFPISAYCLTDSARRSGRTELPYVALFVMMSVGAIALLLVNGSRGGLIAALFGFAGGVAIVLRTQISHWDRRKILAVAGVAALVLSLIMVLFTYSARDLAMERLYDPQVASELRLKALPTLFLLARTYFPFGSGLGSFDPVFRVVEPDSMITNVYLNHAHDDWLELVIETGVIGLGLLLLFTGWVVAKSWKAWQHASHGCLLERLGSILFLQLGAASAFDYPVRTPFFFGVLVFAAVCLAGLSGRASSTETIQ